MKTCIKCNVDKDFSSFGNRVDSIDGKLPFCKSCQILSADKYAIENPIKKCRICSIEKSIFEFPKTPISLKGFGTSCNECNKIRMKRYWAETKELKNNMIDNNLSLTKLHALKRKTKIPEAQHFRQRMFTRAKQRAEKFNLEFDISLNDIIIPEYCPLLNKKLIFGTKKNYKFSPSLDRINSSRGYTKDNIQVISMRANTMKNDATKEELIEFSKNILKFYDIV